MSKTQEVLFAVVGAGDFAVDKVKALGKVADRKTTRKYYRDFVKRGRTVTRSLKSSPQTKTAQTKS